MTLLPASWIGDAVLAAMGAVALAAAAAGGYAVAAKIGAAEKARAEAAHARCEAARAEDAKEAAENAAALLARAQDAEASAASRLAAQRTAFDKRLKEAGRAIQSLSTGRECLSGALRLRLNAAIASDGLPEGTGDADPEHAEPAADSGERAATDADIAGWIADAARRYDECRARIDAIRQWDEVTHGR